MTATARRGPSFGSAVWLCLALALVLTGSADAQEAERPKIGLALSGGGAKGGAHVGVLKVLEELRVPIDYIAGTSMGAIIGGLYASGIPSDELERILLETDWGDVLNDEPNRSDLHFRRKEDDARYLLDLEIGFGRHGLKWPAGLISGQKLYFMLQSLTLPVAGTTDFDRLPIPFRCVATDIQNGEMVVLSKGNLASALRASMAIPTVFSPVQLDGRLLVDGGVTRNLPVDVVRDMGADVVIAVDLGAELSTRDVNSLVRIYQQLSRIQIRTNVEPQLELADVVIKPPVTEYGTMQFDSMPMIIDLGREQADAQRGALEAYASDGEADRGAVAIQRLDQPGVMLTEVRFQGNDRVDSRIIANRIHLEAGDPVNLEAIGRDLGRVYGLGDFEAVTFALERQEEGAALVLNLQEKTWGPNFLHFGFQLNTDFSGDTSVGLLANLTATRLNSLGAEWRSDLLVGTDAAVSSEFYQPLDFPGRWFVAPFVDIMRRRDGYWRDGQQLAELETRLGMGGVDFGYQATKYAEIRLGYTRGRATVVTESGELPEDVAGDLEVEGVDLGALRFSATTDRLDSATFPRRGHRSRIEAFIARESLGAELDYDRWEARVSKIATFGSHSILGSLAAGWSPGGELPPYGEFLVGGFLSLSGFAEGELRGQSYGVARLGYFRRAFGSLYAGGFLEVGNVWQSTDEAGFDNVLEGATIFIGQDSRLGPVYLAYGQSESGNGSVYLVFGRTF